MAPSSAASAAPRGLTTSGVPEAMRLAALQEAEGIFAGPCSTQLGSNQKFFLNLPFPLSGQREADTPVFSWGDGRTSALEALVRAALADLRVPDDLARANVIVREYRPGQKISFHTDDELCGPRVLGLVLLNDRPDRGLVFTKDERSFVLHEEPGATFLLEDQARYAWKHGLPPAPARRVSVTVRFFKGSVELPALEATPAELAPKPMAVSASVTLVRNADQGARKAVKVASPVSLDELRKAAKAKLRMKSTRFFLTGGAEVIGGEVLQTGATVYVSAGEPYGGPARSEETPQRFIASGFDLVLAARKEWEALFYPRLRFYTIEGPPCQSAPGTPGSLSDIGQWMESAHLIVPEQRELVQKLEPDPMNCAFQWRFYTALWGKDADDGGFTPKTKDWAEGRMASLVVEDSERRGWVEFRVEAKPALRGGQKRDGELWGLAGGFNNAWAEGEVAAGTAGQGS